MKIRPSKEQRTEAINAASNLERPSDAANVVLRDPFRMESPITTETRDEMLVKCRAGEYVELYMDLDAYEQREGERNRACVRLSSGAVAPAARSAKGRPFLRDHEQKNTLARGGEIVESKSVKRGDGDYVIRMTVKLTAPWAVEMALRGLLSFISVGLRATGPVMCSHCGTEVFTECWHYRGESIVTKAGAEPQVCEWIYTSAEIVEASSVNVPAVPGAHIEGIRAALSAALNVNHEPEDTRKMKILPSLLAALNLAATASEEEILSAVEAHNKKAKALEAELGIKTKDLEVVVSERDSLKSAKLAAEAKAFIDEAVSLGKIAPADAETWSTLYALDSEKAVKLMTDRKPGTATPVSAPRQSAPAPSVVLAEAAGAPVRIEGGDSPRRSRDPLVGLGVAGIRDKLSDPRALSFAHKFGFEGNSVALSGSTSIANAADHATARIGFHAAFLQSLEQNADDPASMLFAPVQSSRSVEEWNFMGDLPQFEEWTGDRKLGDLKGFKLRIETKKWANGLRVKNDDFKDDALGLLAPQVAGLAQKARRHRWDLMVKMLLNGFSGSAYPEVGDGLAYDGAFFFSDSHLGGNDNKMASALDATALAAAELLLGSMKTLDGSDPLDIYGTHLIVGPKLRQTAEKLMQQERLANGEDNINKGKYKLIVSNRISGTYDDYWFLADLSQGIKPMIFQMREEISTMETGPNGLPAFTADELWFGAQARYNVGYFEPRLIVGSAV